MSRGWVGCAAYESGVVIIRIKAISVQLNLPTGTELGNNRIVIMGANSAGLSSKMKSFESIIEHKKQQSFSYKKLK